MYAKVYIDFGVVGYLVADPPQRYQPPT